MERERLVGLWTAPGRRRNHSVKPSRNVRDAIGYDEDCSAKVQKKTLALAEATRNRNLGYADLDKDLLRMPFAPSWPSTLSLGATVRVKSLV